MWDEQRFYPADSPFAFVILAMGLVFFIRFRPSISGWLGGVAFGLMALRWLLLKPLDWFDERDALFGSDGSGIYRLQFWGTSLYEAARWCLLGGFIALIARRRDETRSPGGPVSKAFSLGWIYGPFSALILLSLLMPDGERESGSEGGGLILVIVLLLMFISLAVGTVFLMMFIHRMWSSIQDGRARTTPGMAVGLSFIPLFNFYWIFQVYWGWTRDFNRYVQERGIQTPLMPERLAIVACILPICGLIPAFQPMLAVVGGVFQALLLSAACDGMNAVARARIAVQDAPEG